MASFLDIDIKNLFSKKDKEGSGAGDKKSKSGNVDRTVLKRIAIAILLTSMVIGVYFFYLRPNLNSQQNQINQVNTWKQQISSCISEIENLENNIVMLTSESELKGVLFVSDDEFENFYAELTEASVRNGLRIINITRGEEIPVRVSEEQQSNSTYNYVPISTSIPCDQNSKYAGLVTTSTAPQTDPNCTGNDCGPIAYYKMSVEYEIEGGFSDYVNFRNVLSNKPKIVNIEKEEISKNEGSGVITAKATVSLVKTVE